MGAVYRRVRPFVAKQQFFELFDPLVMLCGHTQSDPDEEEEDAYEID